MQTLYQRDLAYVQSIAFEDLARGAANEILRRLRNSSTQVKKVMDVGCGAGPLTKVLADAGFEVTGVDLSSELLQMARVNVPKADFMQASAYDIQIRGYDAVIALGEALTYHREGTDAEDVINGLFQRVAEALPAGGLFIFDVIGLGEPSLNKRSWCSGDDWALLVDTTEDQSERSLVRNIEVFRRLGDAYRRSLEVHRVRLFDLRSVSNELAAHGFTSETAQAYGTQPLLPRRCAFFATRLAAPKSSPQP
ncbi:MAG: methyltransferase domain-containing protein [Acidobacteria bacterium]|nr:methyltransferase domain-containing protein [Acidobacteriota bacterium]